MNKGLVVLGLALLVAGIGVVVLGANTQQFSVLLIGTVLASCGGLAVYLVLKSYVSSD